MPPLIAALEDGPFFIALLLCLAVLFFAPAYIAFLRRHRHATAILALTVALFLPAVGRAVYPWPDAVVPVVAVAWIGVLVWSMLAGQERAEPGASRLTTLCPFCLSPNPLPAELVARTIPCCPCGGALTARPRARGTPGCDIPPLETRTPQREAGVSGRIAAPIL